MIISPTILDCQILAFHKSSLLQTLSYWAHDPSVALFRGTNEKADHGHRRLLRTCRERPRHYQSTNSFNEGASSHSRLQGSGPVRTCYGLKQLQQGFTTGGMGSDRHFAPRQSSGP